MQKPNDQATRRLSLDRERLFAAPFTLASGRRKAWLAVLADISLNVSPIGGAMVGSRLEIVGGMAGRIWAAAFQTHS